MPFFVPHTKNVEIPKKSKTGREKQDWTLRVSQVIATSLLQIHVSEDVCLVPPKKKGKNVLWSKVYEQSMLYVPLTDMQGSEAKSKVLISPVITVST